MCIHSREICMWLSTVHEPSSWSPSMAWTMTERINWIPMRALLPHQRNHLRILCWHWTMMVCVNLIKPVLPSRVVCPQGPNMGCNYRTWSPSMNTRIYVCAHCTFSMIIAWSPLWVSSRHRKLQAYWWNVILCLSTSAARTCLVCSSFMCSNDCSMWVAITQSCFTTTTTHSEPETHELLQLVCIVCTYGRRLLWSCIILKLQKPKTEETKNRGLHVWSLMPDIWFNTSSDCSYMPSHWQIFWPIPSMSSKKAINGYAPKIPTCHDAMLFPHLTTCDSDGNADII